MLRELLPCRDTFLRPDPSLGSAGRESRDAATGQRECCVRERVAATPADLQ